MIRNLFYYLLIFCCFNTFFAFDLSNASVAEIVDNSEQVGTHNDIALDSNGFAHICYAEGGDFHFNKTISLKYATNKSGSWVTSVVDNSAEVGGYPSIALDANDNVHISYYDYTNQDLKYATNPNSIWKKTTLLNNGDVGQFTSLSINSFGNIFILFHDRTESALKNNFQ